MPVILALGRRRKGIRSNIQNVSHFQVSLDHMRSCHKKRPKQTKTEIQGFRAIRIKIFYLHVCGGGEVVCTYSSVYVCVRACVWRPKINLRCLPHLFSILFFETALSVNLELTDWVDKLANES